MRRLNYDIFRNWYRQHQRLKAYGGGGLRNSKWNQNIRHRYRAARPGGSRYLYMAATGAKRLTDWLTGQVSTYRWKMTVVNGFVVTSGGFKSFRPTFLRAISSAARHAVRPTTILLWLSGVNVIWGACCWMQFFGREGAVPSSYLLNMWVYWCRFDGLTASARSVTYF